MSPNDSARESALDSPRDPAPAEAVAAAAAPGRLTASLNGVDTLVAVPQWYLNFNLAKLLENGTTTDGKSLRSIEFADASGKHWLKGRLGKIWTDLHVPDSPARVRFILSFASGTFDYATGSGADAVDSNCDIAGLQIGFEVNLSRTAVAQDASLPEDVRKRVEELLGNLGSGAFGIQQVFMDLQNAALDQYDRSVSKFPAGMPQAAIDALPGYLAQYLARLAQAGGHVLGYAIVVGPTVDLPATFPPTELRLAINQYLDGDGKAVTPDLDTLDYQMITKSGAFPANPAPWWGNFSMPGDITQGWAGTLVMSNRLFIQDFLLSRLPLDVLGHMVIFDRNDGQLTPAYEVQAGAFTPTRYGGTFESGTYSGRSHRTNTVSNDDVDWAMSVSVDLSVLPGTNRIGISRRTHFDIHYTHWYGIEGHAAKSEYHVWYQVPLDIAIELTGAQDGKLQVNVTSSTTQPKPGDLWPEPYGWDIVDRSGSYPGWDSIDADIDAAIATMIEIAVPVAAPTDIAKTIQDDLNLHPFVFPGSAQLFLKNPEFTINGDLLLGLQLKV